MNKLVRALVALVIAVVPLHAQSQWTAFTQPTEQGSVFWDNRSSDGPRCNIGYVLTGIAGEQCRNQRPNFLPITPVPVTEQATSSVRDLFGYNLAGVTFNVYGDVASLNQPWGVFTRDGVTVTRHTLGQRAALPTSTAWGVWMKTVDGQYRYSDLHSLTAVFRTDLTNGARTYVVGFEDSPSGDHDYNDVVMTFTTSVVPEPSTYALMATGLLGLGAVARRGGRSRVWM